jgi:hypothetical protein
MRTNVKLEQEVAAIGDLPRDELVARWERAFGHPPPIGMKRGLLEHAAAWRLQAKVLGELSPQARNAMRTAVRAAGRRTEQQQSPTGPSIAEESREPCADGSVIRQGATPKTRPSMLTPGTRLMREWNGRSHVIDVTADGFVFDGKTYRSLTAVAKRITGVQWSGPRFFGL